MSIWSLSVNELVLDSLTSSVSGVGCEQTQSHNIQGPGLYNNIFPYAADQSPDRTVNLF